MYSTRGVIHLVPRWAESVVEEEAVVEQQPDPPPRPMDKRIPVSLSRLDVKVWGLRAQLSAAHKAGDLVRAGKIRRFLGQVSRLRNGVREQARNYNAN